MTVGIAVAFWVCLLAARVWVWHGVYGSVTVSGHRGEGCTGLYAIESSAARRLQGFCQRAPARSLRFDSGLIIGAHRLP